jgi:mRNA interferase MazF
MGRSAPVETPAAEAEVKRGTIAWVNLADTAPPEMGKTRPGLIVSNTEQNAILQTVVVIPLSSQPGEIWPLRLKIAASKNKPSFAVVPGIRQVSKTRLLDTIGFATDEFLEQLREAIAVYLGD